MILSPSHLSSLSLQQPLDLTYICLEKANKTSDQDNTLVLCHEAPQSISQRV